MHRYATAATGAAQRSVIDVTDSTRTVRNVPGSAGPGKIAVLFVRVLPRTRPGSVRDVPSTSTSTSVPTSDWFRAYISQVALLAHRDPSDEAKPYLGLERTPERTLVAQSGLLGEGMPNHKTLYEVLPDRASSRRAPTRCN